MSASANKKRLSKEDWLVLALDAVAKDGVALLRIDRLVKEVGVSKGSFYWHFEDREHFIQELLEYWHEISSLVLNELIDTSLPPEEQIRQLITAVYIEGRVDYESAVRSWAIQDPAVRPYVEKTDRYRHAYIKNLFENCGFDPTEAELRTRVLSSYLALEGAVFDRLTEEQHRANIDRLHSLVTAPLKDA